MTDQIIYYREVAPGRWLAATGVSPYFCFEGESQKEVLDVARRAFAFCGSAKEEIRATLEEHRERTRVIPTFDTTHTISAKELVDAAA